jgi:CxxC motif-containing protein
MRQESLICISCPVGCYLNIEIPEEGEWKITGNKCKRGITYAKAELTNPVRIITTTVKIENAHLKRLPVRSNATIPKELMFLAMATINKTVVIGPVKMGDVIIENILGTGASIIASRSMD